MHLLSKNTIHLLLFQHHDVKNTYKNAFITYHHIILVMHTSTIPYAIFMHLGSEEEITLLEFEEAEEGDQQENSQAAAPEGAEQNPEDLLECPDHRPTSFLRGKLRSILSLLVFYKCLLKYL